MAEELSKRYINIPSRHHFLRDRPSMAERIALRRKNTDIRFRDGFIRHAKYPKKYKPCDNNKYESYQIERLRNAGQKYEEA